MASKQIRFMIVDDEPIAHRIIEDYAATLPHLELVNSSFNALDALGFLNSHAVDLIFLDINMPKLRGFDFLRTLKSQPQVIVTTAYEEYALEGYELNVCDYLLKPFSLPRFLTAVNKAADNLSENAREVSTQIIGDESIFIKGNKKHLQVYLKDITHIEACGNYCLVYLANKKFVTHEKISAFEARLPTEKFMRIHKSFLVGKAHIQAITTSSIQVAEHELPIGQTYKQSVSSLLLID